jgi:hypothetical protein
MKIKLPLLILLAGFLPAAACTPTVKVQAPDKPIEINLNVKIEQEVRVRVERDLENLFEEDPELFGVSASE